MPFAMGFNFRQTSGFVTDGAAEVPVLGGEAYPHTYTNANGYSINAGWDNTSGPQPVDEDASHDRRIAGKHYVYKDNNRNFDIDLSSGSAPGAGTYTIDLAIGQTQNGGGTETQEFTVKDTTTALITESGQATAANHLLDATLANLLATTTWAGTTVDKTFATTLCRLNVNPTGAGTYTQPSHFSLTLQAAGSAAKLKSALMLQGVGA